MHCKALVEMLVTSKLRAPTLSSPCTGRCPRACARQRRRTPRSHLRGCAQITYKHEGHGEPITLTAASAHAGKRPTAHSCTAIRPGQRAASALSCVFLSLYTTSFATYLR